MTEKCLVFHLAGPMCGWGSSDVAMFRGTDTHPTKSAIIGLICAALGIDRYDVDSQTELSESYDIVLASTGNISKIEDFHTIIAGKYPELGELPKKGSSKSTKPPLQKISSFRTAELESGDTATIISTREYVCNAYYSVFLIPIRQCSVTLESISEALKKPTYAPYLGRKSCPLSFPMCPTVVEYDRFLDVVREESFRPFKTILTENESPEMDRIRIYSGTELPDEGLRPTSSSIKRDEIRDRKNWNFSKRREYEYNLEQI